jgi:signal transduction histidine kinase
VTDVRTQLEDALLFEEGFARMSSAFINLPASEVDEHIEEWLGVVGAEFDFDRATLLRVEPDGAHFRISHQWTAMAHRHRPQFTGEVIGGRRFEAPWIAGLLARGEPIIIDHVDDLPPEAVDERAAAESVGVESGVWIPFKVEGTTAGYLSVATIQRKAVWPPRMVRRLQMIGETFGNALTRQKVEAEIRVQRAALAHANRVTMMGELVASISHQLKQPLAAIVTNAQAARRLAGDQEQVLDLREALLDIAADGNRAAEIIDRLRGMFRRQAGRAAPLDMNRVVRDAVRLLEREAQRHEGRIDIELADDLPLVAGEPVQLLQVVLNLILNAGESMAGNPPAERVIRVRTSCDDPRFVRLEVLDRGVGIPADQRDRIFEPFYTSKPDGMGMGLAVCHTIVTTHGGKLAIADNGDRGAIVSFTLPVVEEEP